MLHNIYVFIYIILLIFVSGLNVAPALMPPTWMVLVFFYIKFHLLFLPTILIGALAATIGRIILYFFSKYYIGMFLSKKSKENFKAIGHYINRKRRATALLVFMYTFFSPFPSNQLFIAAGLSNLNIRLIASIFFIGRLLSYTFWVGFSHLTFKSLEGIFNQRYTHISTFIIELLGFLGLFLISRIDWKKRLKI